ncbi:MAG: DUF2799 domain-containing protein [Pseudomonadota bacterium]
MHLNHRLWLTAAALLFVSGCASMSAEECEFSDWYTIGFEDGAKGLTSDAIGERRRACARHGFEVDFAAYQDGRANGLVEYCQPQRGYNVGNAGYRYNGVCPKDLEAEFLDAYDIGWQHHRLRDDVNQVDSEINRLSRERDTLREDIATGSATLVADDTPKEERIRLVAELAGMNERLGEIDARMDELAALRVLREQALYDFEIDLANSY